MKRDFLESLGLTSETIEKVIAENGRDIEREKAKFQDYETIKQQLTEANATLEKFSDYEQTKADVAKYKASYEQAQKDAQQKIAELEVRARIKDFTSAKKFVNDFTRDTVNEKLFAEMQKDESKGVSLDDLFSRVVEGKENILVDENKAEPPVAIAMSGQSKETSGVLEAFKKINPNLQIS